MFELIQPTAEPEAIRPACLPSLALSDDVGLAGPEIRQVRIRRQSTLEAEVSAVVPICPDVSDEDDLFVEERFVAPLRCNVARNPSNVMATVNLGLTLLVYGREEEASEVLSLSSCGAGRDSMLVWHYLAVAKSRLGDDAAALDILRRLQRDYSSDPRPWHAEARIHMKLSAFSEAIVVLEPWVSLRHTSVEMLSDCAIAHIALEDYRGAVRLLRRALRVDPNSALALTNLGVCFGLLGQREKAISRFRAALQCQPTFSVAVTNLAEMLLQTDRCEEAKTCVQAYIHESPQDIRVRELMAWLHLVSKEPHAAREVLDDTLRLMGQESASILNNLAICEYLIGRKADATRLLKRAAACRPVDPAVVVNLARHYVGASDWKSVVSVLPEDVANTSPDALYCRGLALAELGFGREALSCADQLFALTGGSLRSVQFLSFLLVARYVDRRRALEVIEDGLRRFGDDKLLLLNRAYALVVGGELRDARGLLEGFESDFAGQASSGIDVCLHATWGLLHICEGDFAAGIELYESALKRACMLGDPQLVARLRQKIMLERARHLIAQGNAKQARSSLRAVIELGADVEFTRDAQALLNSGASLN